MRFASITSILLCALTAHSDYGSERDRLTEQEFIEIAESYATPRVEGPAGEQDILRMLEGRRDRLGKTLESLKVHDWVGVVRKVDKDQAGGAGPVIELSSKVFLSAGLTEEETGCGKCDAFVPAASPLRKPLENIRLGLRIVFDGEFFKDKQKGPNQGGIVGTSDLSQPQYLFRLTKMRRARRSKLRDAVARVHSEVETVHAAGGGRLNFFEFAGVLGMKLDAETETLVRSRGDLVFAPTGKSSGTFTNSGPARNLEYSIGKIDLPQTFSGTYSITTKSLKLSFDSDHTLVGKLPLINVPLESIAADSYSIKVKVGGAMGGVLSRAIPLD